MPTIINGSGNAITFPDGTIQTTAATGFAASTVLLFYQAAAPTGWTKLTTQNDKALRVVSGTGGVAAGTTAFSTVFANQAPTTGATTLSTTQIPSHDHTYAIYAGSCGSSFPQGLGAGSGAPPTFTTSAAGGGGSHTHPGGTVTLNVQYIDIILCSKN